MRSTLHLWGKPSYRWKIEMMHRHARWKNVQVVIHDWVPNWREAKTPHEGDAMLSEGSYCRYPLEATMMGHGVIAKQRIHCTYKYWSDPAKGSNRAGKARWYIDWAGAQRNTWQLWSRWGSEENNNNNKLSWPRRAKGTQPPPPPSCKTNDNIRRVARLATRLNFRSLSIQNLCPQDSVDGHLV